jgi:hypothetical protein
MGALIDLIAGVSKKVDMSTHFGSLAIGMEAGASGVLIAL